MTYESWNATYPTSLWKACKTAETAEDKQQMCSRCILFTPEFYSIKRLCMYKDNTEWTRCDKKLIYMSRAGCSPVKLNSVGSCKQFQYAHKPIQISQFLSGQSITMTFYKTFFRDNGPSFIIDSFSLLKCLFPKLEFFTYCFNHCFLFSWHFSSSFSLLKYDQNL